MHYKIDAGSNHKNILVQKGDTIEIELDEIPTSGYSWDIERIDNSILGLRSNDYRLHEKAGIGGGGVRKMIFSVEGNGNGKLKLKNAQRWSGDIYQQFEIDVSAQ